ncbi:MAG: hypothetical protein GY930_13585 [bacterium]|nr:hypothetical protein [bacterium]
MTITARHPDFVPIEVGPLTLTPDTNLPPFLMQSGRSLRVSVTDSNGIPMPTNQLTVEAPGHPPIYARAQGQEPLVLEHMPEIPLNIGFDYDEQDFTWTCDASARETTYIIETHGTVEFRPELGVPLSDDAWLIFWITALDSPSTAPGSESMRAWEKWFKSNEIGKVLRVPLLPGRYKAQLFHLQK